MLQRMLLPLSVAVVLCLTTARPARAGAGVVMNYGADGNDYFQFTTPSLAFDKASGFTTLITFAMHVNPDGTLLIGGVACTNGVYVGPTNWNSLVTTLKTPPSTVTRYEVCVGGYGDTSYDNIKSLVASQGTGPGSMLYKNFQALKSAVPGIDAINDDDEQTYDLNSSTSFANLLGGLGYKFTMVPYTAQSFWVNLKNGVTNCDYIYLQCYEGGAGNDPGQWDTAFGNGVVVIPGQESNTSLPATFHSWYLETGVQGGFYYPDVVFESTYWSAAVIEGNGAVPAAPTNVVATHGENEVVLSWNTDPGAISYNVERSTSSGGETTIANVSTANNNWPASNQYTDTGRTTGTTYYYKVSAVNTNGVSLNSVEVNATPPAPSTWTGLGSDNNWGTGGNWNTAPNFPTALLFAGSKQLANSNNLAGITVNNLTFDAAAGAFMLGGNGVTLTGNLGFNGNPATTVTQTVNLSMAWSNGEIIDTPAKGNLTLGGAITSSVDSSLIKLDAGTLTLGGTNAILSWDLDGGTNIISGNTTINGDGGRIYLGDGDYLADCNATLDIQPGAVLNITGSYGDTFVIGRDSGSGTVNQNGGTFTFNPANNGTIWVVASGSSASRSVYNMNGGLLNMSGNTLGMGLGVNGGTLVTGLVNQVSGVITNVGNLWVGYSINGGVGHGTYNLTGGSIYIGANGITTSGGSYEVNLGGGTVGAETSWSSSLKMNLTGINSPVTFNPAGNTITISNAVSGVGGLTVAGGGTLDLAGTAGYQGNTTVNTGSALELTQAGSSLGGALYLSNGASLKLNFSGTCSVAHVYTNNVALPTGVYTSSNLPGYITGSGSLQVAGANSTGLWTGAGANNNWSTGNNWNNNVVPIFPIGLTFAGSAWLTNNNNLSGITASRITFDSAAGAFVLDGNGITLNGNLGFNGNPATPVTQTINLNMALSSGEIIDTPANGSLTLGGAITTGNDLIKQDAGTLTLGGTNSIEDLVVDDGTTTITGNTTLDGNTGVGYDRFYVGDGDSDSGNGDVGGSGTLIIQPGAVLDVIGSFTDTFVIGRDSSTGTVIQNGGTFTFNPTGNQTLLICAGGNNATDEYEMNGGLLDMRGNALTVGWAGSSSTGVLNQGGGVITNLNQLTIPNYFYSSGSGGLGVYTLSGGSIYIGANGITTGGGGSYAINLGGGTVGAETSWSSSLNLNLTGSNGPVTFNTAANTITLSGTLSGSGGLTKTGSGTLILSGEANYLGNTTVAAGSLELNLAGFSPGAFYLSNGASLDLTSGGTFVVSALYTNNVTLPNGVYTSSNLPGFITGSGSLLVSQIPVLRILPVGDSITCGVSSPVNIPGGYRTLLASLLGNLGYNITFTGLLNLNNPPDVIAWHEGHSGAEIAGVNYCMQGVFDSTDDPDIILILLGTNDYNNGIGAGATNRLDAMISNLATNRPNAKIIVANLLLRTDSATLNSEITNTFNPYIPGIVAAHAALGQQVYFTDLRSAVTAAGLGSDGIHPNASGYASMATNWLKAITNVVGIFGATNAPVISHVISQGGLTNIAVIFSKPVAGSATNLANFTLNGGVTISAATLDAATERVVTLTTSPLTQNASYTLTVSNVVDLTAAQTPIAGGTAANFNACGARGATNNVAEASHFQLAYSLDIPDAPNYSSGITYTVDNHAGLGGFGRVAYYLELQATNDGPLQFLWVSMNPFTTNLAMIGVPTLASGAVFQQNVTNMNVESSVAGIVAGTNLSGGNLQFWPYNYNPDNSSGVFDWGNQDSGTGNYGSMEIANPNASQMLLSFNAWGGYGGNADLGIGNNTVYQTGTWNLIDNFTDIQLDWTFRANAATYTVKTLQVFIQPVPVPGTTNLVAVLGGSATLAASDLVALAGNPANYPLSVTAVSPTSTNGSPVSLSGDTITYAPNALGPDQFTYTLSDGNGGTATGTVSVITGPYGIGGQVSGIALTGGAVSLTFTGIPGYKYHVQVSTNLTGWNDVLITNAPAGGFFQFNNNASPMPDAYYRLLWNGN